MKGLPEVTYIRITLKDETIKFMAFVTRDRSRAYRDPSRTNINVEIAKGPFAEDVKHWHYIDYVDIPKDRACRDALRGRADGSYGVPGEA